FMFFGAFGADVGSFGTSFIYAWRERERIYVVLEEVAGDRMFPTYFRPGGVRMGVPDNYEARMRWLLRCVRHGLEDCDGVHAGHAGRSHQLGTHRPDAARHRPEVGPPQG